MNKNNNILISWNKISGKEIKEMNKNNNILIGRNNISGMENNKVTH